MVHHGCRVNTINIGKQSANNFSCCRQKVSFLLEVQGVWIAEVLSIKKAIEKTPELKPKPWQHPLQTPYRRTNTNLSTYMDGPAVTYYYKASHILEQEGTILIFLFMSSGSVSSMETKAAHADPSPYLWQSLISHVQAIPPGELTWAKCATLALPPPLLSPVILHIFIHSTPCN